MRVAMLSVKYVCVLSDHIFCCVTGLGFRYISLKQHEQGLSVHF